MVVHDKVIGWRALAVILCLVIGLWILVGFMPFILTHNLKARGIVLPLQDTGLIGDSFGAANSFFSALGMAGVVVALILQIREQRESRLETEDNKKHAAQLRMIAVLINGRSALLNADHMVAHDALLLSLSALNEGRSDTSIQSAYETYELASKNASVARLELSKLVAYANAEYNWAEISEHISRRFDDIKPASEPRGTSADHV